MRCLLVINGLSVIELPLRSSSSKQSDSRRKILISFCSESLICPQSNANLLKLARLFVCKKSASSHLRRPCFHHELQVTRCSPAQPMDLNTPLNSTCDILETNQTSAEANLCSNSSALPVVDSIDLSDVNSNDDYTAAPEGSLNVSLHKSGLRLSPVIFRGPIEAQPESQFSAMLVIAISVVGLIVCSALVFLGYKKVHKRSRKYNQFNYSHYFNPYYDPSRTSSTAHLASDPGLDPSSIAFPMPTIPLQGTSSSWSLAESDYFPFNSPRDIDYSPSCSAGGSLRGNYHPYLSNYSGQSYNNLPVNEPNFPFYDCPLDYSQSSGKVNFVLHYSLHRQQLLVTLLSAIDLPSRAGRSTVNPFAKLCLLPDKTIKCESKIHRNNRNPVFNEMFIFPAQMANLDERRLKISLWDCDRFGRKLFIGQVIFHLADAGIKSSLSNDIITDEILCPLSPLSEVPTYRLLEILRTDYTRL